jgi:hypothetical protein
MGPKPERVWDLDNTVPLEYRDVVDLFGDYKRANQIESSPPRSPPRNGSEEQQGWWDYWEEHPDSSEYPARPLFQLPRSIALTSSQIMKGCLSSSPKQQRKMRSDWKSAPIRGIGRQRMMAFCFQLSVLCGRFWPVHLREYFQLRGQTKTTHPGLAGTSMLPSPASWLSILSPLLTANFPQIYQAGPAEDCGRYGTLAGARARGCRAREQARLRLLPHAVERRQITRETRCRRDRLRSVSPAETDLPQALDGCAWNCRQRPGRMY